MKTRKYIYATVITRYVEIIFGVPRIIWGSVTLQVALIYWIFIISKWFEKIPFRFQLNKMRVAKLSSTLKVHRFWLCHVTFGANDYDDDDEVYAMIIDMISAHTSNKCLIFRIQFHFPCLLADSLALSKYSSRPSTWIHIETPFANHKFLIDSFFRWFKYSFHKHVGDNESVFLGYKIVLRNIWTWHR